MDSSVKKDTHEVKLVKALSSPREPETLSIRGHETFTNDADMIMGFIVHGYTKLTVLVRDGNDWTQGTWSVE